MSVKAGQNGQPALKYIKEIEHVTLSRRGDRTEGTLYLTDHHILFSYLPDPIKEPSAKQRLRQIWIPYPILAHCTYKPMPAVTRQRPSIRLRCRDFTFLAFQFLDEVLARDAFETIKKLTCHKADLHALWAFSYSPPPQEARCNGWDVYDARREFRRMGMGPKEADRGWRISDINHDYAYSPTYPSVLVVPATISDNVLKYGGSYRSKVRIPALTYLHPVNNCSITRSSQPMVGVFKGKRNAQDERLVASIFATSRPRAASSSLDMTSAVDEGQSQERLSMQIEETTELALASQDDREVTDSKGAGLHHARSEPDMKAAKIYGAQQRNLIIDARPLLNARVNQAAGMGSENMEYYKDATINFLGIDNIHVMRESLERVFEALQHSDYTKLPPDQELLAKSKWLKYIGLVLRGADLVARQIGINHSHVLIHCSDGWDRTSQISALSQLCLDPYYRTLEGFIVLVEKDWLSFGHMFRRRTGPLNSEKWFEIENEKVGGRKAENGSSGNVGASTTFENALLSAKGFFNKKNDSREVLDPDAEYASTEGSPAQARRGTPSKSDTPATKPSETSPIFLQFLDATWQLLNQHPTRFEFNERFLKRLVYQLYACQYGTFLFDNERERVESEARKRTRSVWDYFLSRKEQFINEAYDSTIDDKIVGKERLIFPDVSKVRWWPDLFGRSDEEMNGTLSAPAFSLPKEEEPIVTGIESADVAAGPMAGDAGPYSQEPGNTFAMGAERLTSSLSSLGFGRGSAPISRPDTPTRTPVKQENEQSCVQDSPLTTREQLSFQTFARDSAYREGR